MKVSSTTVTSGVSCLSAVVLATLLFPGLAQAQESAFEGEFSVQRFNPAPGPRNLINSRGARQDGEMTWSGGLMLNYAYRPFVIQSCVSETDCDAENAVNPEDVLVVENLATADLLGSFTPFPELQLGLRLPISFVDGQGITEDGRPNPDEISTLALGDMELEGKYRFFGTAEDVVALAGGAFVTLPFGTLTTADQSYAGDRTVGFGARGIGDVKLGDATLIANLIGMWRRPGRVGSTKLGAELRYSVGAAYAVTSILDVMAEGFGSTKFSAQAGTNTLEALLGARLRPERLPLSLSAGAGTGVLRGVGVPSLRAFLGVTYLNEVKDADGDGIPDHLDGCPTVAEDFDGYQDSDGCPEYDNDDDGVADVDDKCPREAEDFDGFQDDDGCPEPDNDGDGLIDVSDACPDEPETFNKYQDEDGCPDVADTDNDGIPDDRDQCPSEPEDTDGFDDEDGCPDPDNDGDGIPDVQDECIDEPETVNEYEDEDGCPDEAPPPKKPWE